MCPDQRVGLDIALVSSQKSAELVLHMIKNAKRDAEPEDLIVESRVMEQPSVERALRKQCLKMQCRPSGPLDLTQINSCMNSSCSTEMILTQN